jgi:hypothetical protein
MIRCSRMLRDWKILSKGDVGDHLENVTKELEGRSRRPPRLTGERQQQNFVSLASSTSDVGHDECNIVIVTELMGFVNLKLWN